MNSLLSIFCYIISNVSIRKNLHRVQLMTESYPDRQDYSKKKCLICIQGAWHASPNQSGAIKSRFEESLKCQTVKGIHLKWVSNYFPTNLGQSSQDSENLSWMLEQLGACIRVYLKLLPNQHGIWLEPMITGGISPIVY